MKMTKIKLQDQTRTMRESTQVNYLSQILNYQDKTLTMVYSQTASASHQGQRSRQTLRTLVT